LTKLLLKNKLETIGEIPLLKNDNFWTVGRNKYCSLVIPDYRISRIHCTIARNKAINHYFTTDLSKTGFLLFDGDFGKPPSSNGIYISGAKFYQYNLESETTIDLADGTFSLVFIPKLNPIDDDETLN